MKHAESVLIKLLQRTEEDAPLSDLVTLMLENLPFKTDERVAAQLFTSILFHDNLSETLDGCLMRETAEIKPRGLGGQFVYVPSRKC